MDEATLSEYGVEQLQAFMEVKWQQNLKEKRIHLHLL